MSKIKKVIIPAAGLGTRFLPATKAQPKEMLPIVDKPTLQYIIEEACMSGIEQILIITGRNKKSIEDHFDKSIELELELEKNGKLEQLEMIRRISNMIDIQYVRQKEPKGLGDAIYCARHFINNEPFAIILGDDIVDSKIPCLKQLIDIYDKKQTSVIGVQKVNEKDVSKYGIVEGDKITENLYIVKDLVEKPPVEKAPSNIAILGRYILSPDIFHFLENQPPGKNGEIQLTDALKALSKSEDMYAYIFDGERFDVGDKIGFLSATIHFALKRDELKKPFLKNLKEILKRYEQTKEV